VNHKKGYRSAEEAARSKAAQVPGATIDENCRCGLVHVDLPAAPPVLALKTRARLRPVSAKRRQENRERKAMAAALWPDGRPLCFVPWCGHWADDLHEPLTRARGGSITDPENAFPLCRPHHDEVTFRPESELGWAYDLGLLRHSWDVPRGGEVA
jgi:hypothetical protein